MELLAHGRDADVFALDEQRVLHRRRRDPPASWQVELNAHLREHGYPTPAVLDVDGTDTVYERVHGPSMMDELASRPWKVGSHARQLAELHRRLHAVPAPAYLPLVGQGGQVLHLDLHPGNVLLGADGPVVIDWTNAAAGIGSQDVALTWVLLRTAPVPATGPVRRLLTAGRRIFLGAFLRASDREAAQQQLSFAIDYRLQDRSLMDEEKAALEEFNATN